MERPKIATVDDNSGGKYFLDKEPSVSFFSTGCTVLDCALGGGWAEDRILNIVGSQSVGKTLLCEEALANFAYKHKTGLIRYKETEKAFDIAYAENLGVPLNRIEFDEENPCYTVEDVYNNLKKFAERCKKKSVKGLYILDSLDAVSSESELTKEFGAATMGASKAKDMSQLFRMLNQVVAENHVTVMIISQVRDAIGVTFGRGSTRSGGRALDFFASQVIYLANLGRITQTIKGVTRPIGNTIRTKVDKCKVGLPYRECDFPLLYAYGVDDLSASIDWLVSVKRESELGIELDRSDDDDKSDDDGKKKKESKAVSAYKKSLKQLSDDQYGKEREKISAIVRRVWKEIESGFLPQRKKYR